MGESVFLCLSVCFDFPLFRPSVRTVVFFFEPAFPPSVVLSVRLSVDCLSAGSSARPFVSRPAHPSVRLTVRAPIPQSVRPSVRLLACLRLASPLPPTPPNAQGRSRLHSPAVVPSLPRPQTALAAAADSWAHPVAPLSPRNWRRLKDAVKDMPTPPTKAFFCD